MLTSISSAAFADVSAAAGKRTTPDVLWLAQQRIRQAVPSLSPEQLVQLLAKRSNLSPSRVKVNKQHNKEEAYPMPILLHLFVGLSLRKLIDLKVAMLLK